MEWCISDCTHSDSSLVHAVARIMGLNASLITAPGGGAKLVTKKYAYL